MISALNFRGKKPSRNLLKIYSSTTVRKNREASGNVRIFLYLECEAQTPRRLV